MTSHPHDPALSPGIRQTLARLRSRIRWYIWAEGLALGLAWLGLAFWLTLAVDRLPVTMGNDEPDRGMRIAMLAGAAAVLLGLLGWFIVRRLAARLSDHSMAILLERRFGTLDDALLTTVELREQPAHAREFHPEMLERTFRSAEERTQQVRVGQVFNRGPLFRAAAFAALLLGSIGVFAALAPEAFGIWSDRYLLLQDRTWPRKTRIAVVGPEVRKSARGDDVTIEVLADTRFEVPRTVRLHYRNAGGTYGRENMVRQGEPRDGFQKFTFTFPGRLESFEFDAVGADYRVRDYRVEIVDSPTAALTLDLTFPEYLVDERFGEYTPREEEAKAIQPYPQGTQVRVKGLAQKPLREVHITMPGAPGETSPAEAEGESGANGRSGSTASLRDRQVTLEFAEPTREFVYQIDSLDQDVTLLLHLLDVDGIRNREPIRLSLVAEPDKIPQVEMRLRGIGLAVTPQVRLPAAGQITDDHGVSAAWFEYYVDDEDTVAVPFTRPIDRNKDLLFEAKKNEEVLDIREEFRSRAAAAGRTTSTDARHGAGGAIAKRDELATLPTFATQVGAAEDAEAADSNQAPAEANPPAREGAGEERGGEEAGGAGSAAPGELQPGQKLTVVIKARDGCTLGSDPREGASQRFDLKVVSPEELRGILAGRELNLRQQFERIVEEVTATRDALTEIVLRVEDVRGGRLPDLPADGDAEAGQAITVQRLRSLGYLRTQRAQQNSTKNAGEVMHVALQFDDICDELYNNRLFTEEYERRLQDGIAVPLKHVGGPMFLELARRLERLEKSLSEGSADSPEQVEASRAALLAAQLQADAILVRMHDVLNKMVELEAFNKAIELLREIVESQKRLNSRTKEHQLKSLTE